MKLAWTLQPVSFSAGTKDTSDNHVALAAELSDVHCLPLDDLNAESISNNDASRKPLDL